ncbi:hypothetical protein VTO42DRAFT_3410 [Malbranchea cinnamomea]
MATTCNLTSSAPSNSHRAFGDDPSSSSPENGLGNGSWHGTTSKAPRNVPQSSSADSTVGTRGAPFTPAYPLPGGFNSDLRGHGLSRSATPRPGLGYFSSGAAAVDDEVITTEQRQAIIRDKIEKEMKIKTGTENMLEALLSKNPKQTKEQRLRVENELSSSNRKLEQLHQELEQEVNRSQSAGRSGLSHLSTLFNSNTGRTTLLPTGAISEEESETESPTYVLAETLQALEVYGMQPDYYVERANSLVELFKRYPTLKYDLEWSVFGLRVQTMLLSDSREVVAAGYRLTRYAIADRKSIQTIRSLHTDELVMLSLMKETKASIEREQAIKFIRAFLDVKDGVNEISRAVVRTLVSIADHREDRLRNISIMTLAEILVRDPALLFSAGGIGTLNDALAEGTFGASESLTSSFLHVLDSPRTRKYLTFGCGIDAVFSCFTEALSESERNARLPPASRAISVMLRSWPGLLSLAQDRAKPLRSLLQSLQYPEPTLRNLILDLLFEILRIKTPSWSQSYLAGRRLTTYGRVTNLRSSQEIKQMQALQSQENNSIDLTSHFSTLLLALLIDAGLIQALSDLVEDEKDLPLKRKATLMLTEVLKRANHSLPQSMCAKLQVLPQLIRSKKDTFDIGHVSTSTIYQIDSINRTMMRTDAIPLTKGPDVSHTDPTSFLSAGGAAAVSSPAVVSGSGGSNLEQTKLSPTMDEAQFRTAIMDTNVLNSSNFLKWNWDLIHAIVEGPLTNPKRLDEAIKGSKFMKRLMGFYRPFKYRFSTVRNTKPNQRYVRTGCALIRTLLQSPEGTKHLAENKLLRQIAECLAQVDRMSGLTSEEPVFSQQRVADTLCGGYFALLGTLSREPHGLQMMERWHMPNMFYHIVELKDRNDLIMTLLGNMDYTLESHLRIILSKALTTGSKEIRIFATGLLKKYVVGRTAPGAPVDWVIKLLVTQLYDPDVSVCQVAVKILEEACIERDCLEYVVRCRPSLDHLGEIGAPLLLRFLSTSIGYKYLHGLDYITQEMDDWFLGRNDAYVGLVEATLSRAYADQRRPSSPQHDEGVDTRSLALLPPHFYRELARTTEGCQLLEQSGHFEEFASTIRNFRVEEDDPEVLLKVKGCLWAVGNLGSMELGAPFLEESEIVKDIVRIAENAAVLTMRGTAFFVLGLISRSEHGLELVFEAGWVTAVDDRGRSLGWCIPADPSRLCSAPFTPYITRAGVQEADRERYNSAVTDPDPVIQKILRLIIDLGNSVVSKRAASDLQRIKAKRPEYFRQIHIFRKVLVILENHHLKFPARRFALDLFEKEVLRRLVLGEEESGEETNSMSDSESIASE